MIIKKMKHHLFICGRLFSICRLAKWSKKIKHMFRQYNQKIKRSLKEFKKKLDYKSKKAKSNTF